MVYNNGNGNVSIDFNLCEYNYRKCPDEDNDYANIINENNTCDHMSSDDLSQVGVSLIDTENPEAGLLLEFTGGNSCNDTSKFVLTVQLNCDSYAKELSYEID